MSGVIVEGEIWADETAELPLRVLATDADTGVENWGWTATVTIDGATLPKFTFRAPQSGVHLTGNDIIPVTGSPVEIVMPDLTDYATIGDVHTAIGEADLGLNDTGARSMASVWTGARAPQWLIVTLRRVGPVVSLSYMALAVSASAAPSFTLPSGFRRPAGSAYAPIVQMDADLVMLDALSVLVGEDRFSFSAVDTSSYHMGSAVWLTTDPWPDVLPGTPA